MAPSLPYRETWPGQNEIKADITAPASVEWFRPASYGLEGHIA